MDTNEGSSLALYLHCKSKSLQKTLKVLKFSKINRLKTWSKIPLVTTENIIFQ